MVVSPDVGGVVRARALAKRIDAQLAIVDKRRERPGESEVMNIIGDVAARTACCIDDIVDSGGTLCNAADALLANGATSVTAYITHGVLSGGAVARIAGSKLKELVITDSIQPTSSVEAAAQHPRHLDRRPDRRGDLAHGDRGIGVEPVRLIGQNPLNARPAAIAAASTANRFALKRISATPAANAMTAAARSNVETSGIPAPLSGPTAISPTTPNSTCSANHKARLAMMPTTAAVTAASAVASQRTLRTVST